MKLNEEQLRELVIENMRIGIKEVIDGKSKKFASSLICMSDVKSCVESFGGEEHGDFDTNGWQWDAWQNFKVNGKLYNAFAEGYYGGVTFSLNEDEEEWE